MRTELKSKDMGGERECEGRLYGIRHRCQFRSISDVRRGGTASSASTFSPRSAASHRSLPMGGRCAAHRWGDLASASGGDSGRYGNVYAALMIGYAPAAMRRPVGISKEWVLRAELWALALCYLRDSWSGICSLSLQMRCTSRAPDSPSPARTEDLALGAVGERRREAG